MVCGSLDVRTPVSNAEELLPDLSNYVSKGSPFRKRINPSMELPETIHDFWTLAASLAIRLKQPPIGSMIISFSEAPLEVREKSTFRSINPKNWNEIESDCCWSHPCQIDCQRHWNRIQYDLPVNVDRPGFEYQTTVPIVCNFQCKTTWKVHPPKSKIRSLIKE